MATGEITVTGKGVARIELLARPQHVHVHFVKDPVWIPCNHHHHDHLKYFIDHEDEDSHQHHRPGHIHHDRKFVLVIVYEVVGVEEIRWSVTY